MNVLKRRDFFKYMGMGLAGVVFLKIKNDGSSLFLNEAIAIDSALAADKKDAAIKMQDYISLNKDMDGAAPVNNSGKPSTGKAKWEAHKKDGKLAKGELPACSSCKFYKDPKDGYGTCAMVQATGKAPDKWVNQSGWCKLWSHK